MKRFLFLLFASQVLAAEPMSCNLQGILLAGYKEELKEQPVKGVVVRNVTFLEKNPQFIKELEVLFLGKPVTEETLQDIKNRIVKFYRDTHQVFVSVSIPPQAVVGDVVKVRVMEAKLGEIRSKGNRYFSGSELMGYIRTKQGQTIIQKEIFEDLAWMNQNPFRKTDLIFRPGDAPGVVDLDLMTTDRWPYRVYTGADNTGTISTNRNRLFFGFNFGKTILQDSQVSYQFTFAPNWNRFYAHTASARIPCPWHHLFVVWGGYSQAEPLLDVSDERQKITDWQVDVRYRIPVMETPDLMQTILIGYDFKETHNNLKQFNQLISKETADINQFMLGYELGVKRKDLWVTLNAEAYGNPGGITDKNRRRDYERFRFDGNPVYVYVKAAHSFGVRFGHGWGFSYDLSGQYATRNLLASEQFNLTGYDAVRGFEERVALVDNGALFSVNFETPHMSPTKWLGAKSARDELYFLAFFDGGLGTDHQRSPGEKKFKTMGSIGPGARYQFSRYVTAHLDYGFQLWHRGFNNPTHSRYNFGLIVSY